MARCLLIGRSVQWSPGPDNPSKDAAILQSVKTELEALGHQTLLIGEEELRQTAHRQNSLSELRGYDCIFSMARSLQVLMLLKRSGVPCINAPRGVMHTSQSREDTLTLLQTAGLPIPPFWAYEAEEDEMFLCEPHLQQLLPAWIKAMHPQGVRPDDVTLVNTPLEADTLLLRFQASGYSDIVAMHHVQGTLVKCYTVIDRCKSSDNDQRLIYINNEKYRQIALTIADTLDLQVFGFDLIVEPDGQPWIIDVNDWPSFSSVREEAARAIASLI